MTGELAGLLDTKVTIERRDPERDGLGGAAGEWAVLRVAWAAISPIRGRDETWWRLVMRDEAPVAAVGDRVRWGGRLLELWVETRDPRLPDRVSFEAEEAR